MAIKSLFFDFGNVVAFFDHRIACRKLADLSDGRFYEDEIYQALFQPGGLENQFDRGELSTGDFIRQMTHTFTLSAEPREVERAWCDIFSLNQPVVDLLYQLKDSQYQLFLASNTNALHYRWIREEYANELSVFDDEILSFEIGFRKPEQGFFKFCVKRSGGLPSECAFIDDRSDFVAAAGESGMNGILFIETSDLVCRLEALGLKVVN